MRNLVKLSILILVLLGLSTMVMAAGETAPTQAQVQTPTEADIVQLFPNASKVDGVGSYLFIIKSVAIGPSYTIAKAYNLVNFDIQFASIAKGGSYFGGGASVEVVDLIRKLGKDPADLVVAFNPSLGVTGGWRSAVGNIPAGMDGGIRAKILNVDTAKLVKWLGL